MIVRKAKKTGKKQWMLDLGLVDGKRQRIFYKTKKKADDAMKDRQSVIDQHGQNALSFTHSERLEYQAWKNRAAKINMTPMQCILYCETHYKETEEKPLTDAVEDCIKAKIQSGKREKYTNALRASLRRLVKLTPPCMVSAVTAAQVESWARAGAESLATVKGRLIDANTFFNFCIKRGWRSDNPVKEIEKVHVEDKPPGIHTVEQVEAVLRCALENDREILGYIICIYFGGMRPAESAKLTLDKIHEDSIEVESTIAKTRRRRFIPINDTLRAWMQVEGIKYGMSKRSAKLDRIRWILSGKETKKDKWKHNRKKFTKFPWPHDVMLHSFCSYGVPKFGAAKTAEWAGKSERILHNHYRERVKPADAEKFWALRP